MKTLFYRLCLVLFLYPSFLNARPLPLYPPVTNDPQAAGCKIEQFVISQPDNKIVFTNDQSPRSVFVTPPKTMEIMVRTCSRIEPSYIEAVYDDFNELDKTVKLVPAGNGWYKADFNFETLPDPIQIDPANAKENFNPRDIHFKRIDFYGMSCDSGWIHSDSLTQTMWDRCVKKRWSQNYWFVWCHNGQRELELHAKDFESFKWVLGAAGGVKVWLNQTQEITSSIPIDITVKTTKLASVTQKVTDESGHWRSVPEFESGRVIFGDKEVHLSEFQSSMIQKRDGSLKISWKMKDSFMNIKPMAVHLSLFRPNTNGQTSLDISGEEASLSILPPETSWNNGDELSWIIKPGDFKKVGSGAQLEPGFRSGNYTFKILVSNFAANHFEKYFSFYVEDVINDFHAPAVKINNERNGIVKIHDFGQFSSISGFLEDGSLRGNQNIVWMTLYKESVILSSSPAILAPNQTLVSWSIPLNQELSDLLPNGTHYVELRATDSDGNQTKTPVTFLIDVSPFDLGVDSVVYTRSEWIDYEGGKQGFIDLYLIAKENSFLTLTIDGQIWAKNIFTSAQRNFKRRVFGEAPLRLGKHTVLAELERNGVKKSQVFEIIVDHNPPKILSVNGGKGDGEIFPMQKAPVNFLNEGKLKLNIEIEDEDPAVKIYAETADSIEDVTRLLSGENIQLHSSDANEIVITPNKLVYLGISAVDRAGNRPDIQIYPLYHDTAPPIILIGKVEQGSIHLKDPDRNLIWILLSKGETDPSPARYDLSVSLSKEGPWELITRSVIGDDLGKDPWIWNGLLQNEEWLNIEKIGKDFIPFNIEIQKIKKILGITQFPGNENNVPIYFQARSVDLAGNTYIGDPQEFSLSIDRKAPEIILSDNHYEIIEFNKEGGTIVGRVRDEPREGKGLTVELFKGKELISQVFTNEVLDGEFALYIPMEKSNLFSNGENHLTVTATDVDGNKTERAVDVFINVLPLSVGLSTRVEAESQTIRTSKEEYTLLDIDIPALPNSQVTLRVNGRTAFEKLKVGSVNQIKGSIKIPFILENGEYPAIIQIYKNGRSVSKIFTLNVKNPFEFANENPPQEIKTNNDTSFDLKNPPTLKISVRLNNSVILEGTAPSDPTLLLVLANRQGRIMSKVSLYPQGEETATFWNKELKNLTAGDYEIYAYCENRLGTRSPSSDPVHFTIFDDAGIRPKLNDFTNGRITYSATNRPTITGNAGFSESQVQILETGNYLGFTFSDPSGNFKFMPEEGLKNGWKNFTVVVNSPNGQRIESDVLKVYLAAPDGLLFAGTNPKELIAGAAWDLRFTPNGDGINDEIVFSPEDVPIQIMGWRTNEIVKTVTDSDQYRWDGRKDNGVDCEQSIYLAKTNTSREIVISLYR